MRRPRVSRFPLRKAGAPEPQYGLREERVQLADDAGSTLLEGSEADPENPLCIGRRRQKKNSGQSICVSYDPETVILCILRNEAYAFAFHAPTSLSA